MPWIWAVAAVGTPCCSLIAVTKSWLLTSARRCSTWPEPSGIGPNVICLEADLREVTPERDGPFDVGLSAYALHHVTELETVLQQIRSLVVPGGRAVLIDIVDRRDGAVDPVDQRLLSWGVPEFDLRSGGRDEPAVDLVDYPLVVCARTPIVLRHGTVVFVNGPTVLGLHPAVVRLDLPVVGADPPL
jgi:SAM-dependent methyltransferase